VKALCDSKQSWPLVHIFRTVLLLLVVSATHAHGVLRMCEDDNYAPFVYRGTDDGHAMRGATVELVRSFFLHSGIAIKIDPLPWARCLAYVKDGTYQVGMDAYYDAERARSYVYTRPYFTLTPQYYYSHSRFPGGLVINRRADLRKYHGCGIHDYSYAHYGLGKQEIAANVEDHAALVRKIKGGRCDYFVEELEVMQGFALTGQNYLSDPDLVHGPISDVPPPQLHFILTRDSSSTAWLLPFLNRQITVSQRNGQMHQLVNRLIQPDH
jgi:polar amino acid transport system substrate-binding protein